MESVINIENLSVSFYDKVIFNHFNLNIYDDYFLIIKGHNGTGKTTLLKSILGLIKFDGKITINQNIAYVPQFNKANLKFPITVKDMLGHAFFSNGIHPFKKISHEEEKKIDQLLKDLNLFELKNNSVSALSGGQYQRILIARALLIGAKTIILDEPTASVDNDSKKIIYKMLNELSKKHVIILVSHDLVDELEYNHVLCLKEECVYEFN